MTKLDLSHNVLHGTIPSKILLSLASKLVEFYLKDNQLVGSIPTEIGLLTSMQYLSLAENYLSEQIPTHIGLLTNMKNLGLNNLDIDGHIPTEIGLCTSLEYINANSCDLSGTLPSVSAHVCAHGDSCVIGKTFCVNLTLLCYPSHTAPPAVRSPGTRSLE